MNIMEKEGGRLFILITLEIPLLISLFFFVKSSITHIRNLRTLKDNENEVKREKRKLLLYVILILLTCILGSVLFILPHMALALTFLVFIFTIFAFLYSILGLLRGLGDVKGAGGSPAKILITLSDYLSDYFNISGNKESLKDGKKGTQEK